jgi:hypothetical protein
MATASPLLFNKLTVALAGKPLTVPPTAYDPDGPAAVAPPPPPQPASANSAAADEKAANRAHIDLFIVLLPLRNWRKTETLSCRTV